MKFLFFILILLTCTSFNSNNVPKWKLEKSHNGITIYSYLPENKSIKEIKSHTVVNTTLSTLVAILSDVDNYKNWIYNCIVSKKVEKVAKNKMYYYTKTNAPWPLSNRDLIAYNKIFQDKASKIVYSISVPKPKKMEEQSGVVRIFYFYGEWKFTPLKNGKIAIDYHLKIDPAGLIPAWITNLFIENGPYQTLLKFKAQITKEKYKNATFDYIVD